MTREKIIDEVANNRMRFVSELGHDTASEYAGAPVPFEINGPMRSFAVNFRPTVRTPRALVFGGDQVKAPKLGIVHNLFAQRSAPARDNLNHRLHLVVRFNSNPTHCNFSFMWRRQSSL